MLIDTHAHLDFPDFEGEVGALLGRARAAGVDRVITIGTTTEGSARAVELAAAHPEVFAAVGIHPSNASSAGSGAMDALRALAGQPRVAALGEIGLDYHRLPSRRKSAAGPTAPPPGSDPGEAAALDEREKAAQAEIFRQQLELAVELGLNVVIHEREAWEDTRRILAPYAGKLRAVFHCFGRPPSDAADLAREGHLVSFTGLVTFKNAPVVQQTAAEAALGGFMVETDCPFLAPTPHRGKRCEPAYTRLVAERIAALREEPLEEIARRTTAAAEAFFRLG